MAVATETISAVRSAVPARDGEVVNLCFHGIGAPERALEPDEDQYWIEMAQFEELVAAIKRHPEMRITFDDGNASDVTCALPVLAAENLHASFFVVAGRLDQPGSISRAGVRDLAGHGMTVGSHGMFHRPFRSLDDDELRAELGDATAIISEASGAPVRALACPFGSYDRRVLNAARRHGFDRVYTVDGTVEGASSRQDAWLQCRYTIRRHDTPETIERLARSPRGSRYAFALRTGKTVVKRLR